MAQNQVVKQQQVFEGIVGTAKTDGGRREEKDDGGARRGRSTRRKM